MPRHLRACSHRLLDEHMLSTRRGQRDVLGMMLMRRGDVNHLDAGIGAELLDRRIRPRAEVGGETRGRLDTRVRGRDQLEAQIRGQVGEHKRERAPQTRDADA